MKTMSKPTKKLLVYSTIGLVIMFLTIGLSTVLIGISPNEIKTLNPIEYFSFFRLTLYVLFIGTWQWFIPVLVKRKYLQPKLYAQNNTEEGEFSYSELCAMEQADLARLLTIKTRLWVFAWILFVEIIVVRQGQGVFY